MDTILGNIGEPLRVEDGNDEIIDEDNREESAKPREIPESDDRVSPREELGRDAEV